MATATILTAYRLNMRRVDRRLSRAGYVTATDPGRLRVSRHDPWDTVDVIAVDPADLSEDVIKSAARLLGSCPRFGVRCRFDGPAGATDAWTTVVAIAKAVAAEVPLAVVNDDAGTTYLVHPGRGLVGPEEYEKALGSAGTASLLRRFLGGR